jgi:hypothetical protein
MIRPGECPICVELPSFRVKMHPCQHYLVSTTMHAHQLDKGLYRLSDPPPLNGRTLYAARQFEARYSRTSRSRERGVVGLPQAIFKNYLSPHHLVRGSPRSSSWRDARCHLSIHNHLIPALQKWGVVELSVQLSTLRRPFTLD